MVFLKKIKKYWKLFPLLFSLFLVSCLEKRKSPYTDYDISSTLRYPIASEPPTLDWTKSTDRTSSLIISNIMSGLFKYNFLGDEVKVEPDLALSYKNDPAYRIWSFQIKNNVRWSDGKFLKAQDFVDSWQRLLNPKTGSEYAYFLFPIKNARAYNEGRIKDFKKVGIQVKGSTLIVTLEKSMAYFPHLLTHSSSFPIRKDVIKKHQSLWTHPKNILTLGPYTLKKWDHDKALILERNKKYYSSLAKLEKIILYIVPDEKTTLDLFLTGRLDVVTQLSSRDLLFYKKRKDYKKHSILSLYYYGFNTKDPFLKNVNIRRALIHAIDRKQIVNLLKGGQTPLKSWIPKGIFAYNQDIGLSFDLKKARKFLKLAGYSDSRDLPVLALSYNTTADHKMIAENIQSQLKKHLNLRVELKNQEWKTYLQKLSSGDMQMFRLGWLADYPDPDNFMNLMTSFSDNNRTYWKNKTYDSLILKARTLPDDLVRKSLYDKAQKILLEKDAVAFPIFSSIVHQLVSPRLKNYPLNVMSDVPFEQIEIGKDR